MRFAISVNLLFQLLDPRLEGGHLAFQLLEVPLYRLTFPGLVRHPPLDAPESLAGC